MLPLLVTVTLRGDCCSLLHIWWHVNVNYYVPSTYFVSFGGAQVDRAAEWTQASPASADGLDRRR